MLNTAGCRTGGVHPREPGVTVHCAELVFCAWLNLTLLLMRQQEHAAQADDRSIHSNIYLCAVPIMPRNYGSINFK